MEANHKVNFFKRLVSGKLLESSLDRVEKNIGVVTTKLQVREDISMRFI